MNRIILFPFDIKEDNQNGYATALQLAEEQNAEIILFTSLAQEGCEAELDKVYLHLLALHGYYQKEIQGWGSRNEIKIKRSILCGNWLSNFGKILQEKKPDYVVFQNHSSTHQKIKKEISGANKLTMIFV